LSGSCDETVTSVKPPYRTRSQLRFSSLAAIARGIVDDRALKAPGQSSCSVARVLAMPRGFPRPRSYDEGGRDDDRSDQVYDDRFVSAFPAVEAGHRQQTDEEADEHRGGVVEDGLLVVGAARRWSGSRR